MTIEEMLESEYQEQIQKMDAYINHLKRLPEEVAKKEALEGLIRTGVLDESGKAKEKIVLWE